MITCQVPCSLYTLSYLMKFSPFPYEVDTLMCHVRRAHKWRRGTLNPCLPFSIVCFVFARVQSEQYCLIEKKWDTWVISVVKWSEVAQSCPTLCDPMDCSLPGFSTHGIFQARVPEWVAISFSNKKKKQVEFMFMYFIETTISRIL